MTAAPLGALAPIVERKRREAAELRCRRGTLWGRAETIPPAQGVECLAGGAVVAEMKRRSPSAGALRQALAPAALAAGYQAAGAAAISVLTDGPGFGGSLADLAEVRAATTLPVLRKDFIVDPVQIAEARVAGADWVLLITAVLGGELLDECLAAARRGGARALVEVHTDEEARRALAAGAECIGVNNRDLRTLMTDLDTFSRIRPLVPAAVPCLAESGVRTAADVSRLVGEGADAVLVGEALMRAADPGVACAEMVKAARAAARAPSSAM